MGMQDRDYYKEAWKKRGRGDMRGYHTGNSGERLFSEALRTPVKSKKFQPFWLFLSTVVICGIIFVVLKIISQLLR